MRSLSPNLRGILLMTLAMALLASADAAIKLFADGYSRASVLMLVGAGGFVIFAAIARLQGQRVLDRRALLRPTMLRTLAEALASWSMILALAMVPFNIITLSVQAMPLTVTLGAVLFFGERVGWRRWAAIAIGFAGVVVVMAPTGQGFSPEWLLALLVMLALSFRDLVTRAVPRDISTVQIATWGNAAVFVVGVVLHLASGDQLPTVPAADILPLAFIVLSLGAGVYTVSAAMRTGDVSVVAPFRYTRLPFGLTLGILVFGEAVTLNMAVGAAIIVGSGLFIFLRERQERAG